jgi:uncharacterized protein (TIGR02246 family)
MPMSRRAATAALLLLTLATFKSAGAETVREAVERANRAFIAAYAAHDSGKLALLYASDAAALPPGGDRANGREAIRRVWQGAMDAGVTNVTVRTIEVEARGDLAYEGGEYGLDAPGKDGKLAHSAGKYIVVWKRHNGTWQLYRDIWNETPAH